MSIDFTSFTTIVIIIVVLYLLSSIKILREYERAVIFRLGRLLDQPKGPGITLVFAPIGRMVRVSLRIDTLEVPAQDVITRDNVTVKVNAVVYFRVIEPRHRPPGRSRARAARQDHSRRRRIQRGRETLHGRHGHPGTARGDPVALPANTGGNRHRKKYHHRFPSAARYIVIFGARVEQAGRTIQTG